MRPRWRALAGLAAIFAGCSSGSGGGSDPDQPAGEVVELTGQVAAARPSAEPRPLEVGAPVYADDTVSTEAGASVLIRLSHNNASWRLDEGRSRRIDQSLAWKAPERERDSVLEGDDPEDRTAAAGRHSEREAAETRATAMADEAATEDEAASPEPTATGAAEEAAPTREASPAKESRRTKRKRKPRRPRPRRSAKPKPEPAESPPRLEAEPPPPRPPSAKSSAGSAKSGTRGGSVDPGSRIRSKIKVCHALAEDAPAGSIAASVTIDDSGRITRASIRPSAEGLAQVARCAEKKLLGMQIPGAEAGVHRVEIGLR